jgi:hypothetical protein
MGNTESVPPRPRRVNPNILQRSQQRNQQHTQQRGRPHQTNPEQYNNLNQQQLHNSSRLNAINLTDQMKLQQKQLDSQHQHQLKLEQLVEQQQQQNERIQTFIEQQTLNQTTLVEKQPIHQEKINKLNSFTPYEILGVTEFSTIEEIKASYKKKVLKYHPDRGGDPGVFSIIEKSYKQLTHQKQDTNYYEKKINQDVKKVEYDASDNNMQNKYIDKDNFNINKFNTIFSENSIDDINDDGYGHIMSNEAADIEKDKTQQPCSNFSLNSFNDEFHNKKQQNKSNDIVEYKEPEPLISNTLGYSDLGGGKLSDYSNDANSSFQYTDYKKAHITDNTLIDPSNVKYKEFKNVNDLKMARSNVRHKMTPEELRIQEIKQHREKEKDQIRQTRLKEYDYKVETQFNKLNTNMIRN